MKREPYPEVVEAANPCTADAPKLDGESSLEWFQKREPLVRKLVGVCEDTAPPGGVIDAAWDELVSWEADAETNGLGKPKETEATEQASPSEPVETRLAADGGLDTPLGRAMHWIDHCRNDPAIALDKPEVLALAAEVRRLREERDMFAEAGRAAELRIVELKANHASLIEHHDMWKQQWEEMRDTMWKPAMAKLARVEAIISGIDPHLPITANREALESIAATLRDEPQPEREPKLPYNGY